MLVDIEEPKSEKKRLPPKIVSAVAASASSTVVRFFLSIKFLIKNITFLLGKWQGS